MAIAIVFPILVLFFISCCGDTGVAHDTPPARMIPGDYYKHHTEDRISSPSLLSSPSTLSARILDVDCDDARARGPDGRCHSWVTTEVIRSEKAISGQGIVFAVRSDEADDDGPRITSFGFHVDPASVANGAELEYKIYVLEKEGHYASTERDETINSAIAQSVTNPFDYRGKLDDSWELIADGFVSAGNLTKSTTTLETRDPNLFRIPHGRFGGIPVPGNGGHRSFYIATVKSGLIYSIPVGDKLVNDEMDLVVFEDDAHAPKILVGEGLATYPMPTSVFSYHAKSFVGEVYYEIECSSQAPSASGRPTPAPIAPSQSPSSRPSQAASGRPSAVPSEAPSSRLSSVPSIEYRQIAGGLKMRIAVDCAPGEPIPKEERDDVGEAVGNVTEKEVERVESKSSIINIDATVVDASCAASGRRDLVENARAERDFDRRRLPRSSSAMDFSVVITGEYSPAQRIGDGNDPVPDVDLGAITEDSINRDPAQFVRDLSSRFSEVDADGVRVQSFEVNDDFNVEEDAWTIGNITLAPTSTPTSSPTTLAENKYERTNGILLICIIATAGIILLLSAFLIFRYGERRAAQQRRERMAQLEEEKAKARLDNRRKAEAEKADLERRHKEMWGEQRPPHPGDPSTNGPPPYGTPPLYGYPPPPSYYAGGLHPQGPNYGYGRPPHPPPPPCGEHYGEQHGAPHSVVYPYPPPPGRGPYYGPPGQGASYDRPPLPLQDLDANHAQRPDNARSVRWK